MGAHPEAFEGLLIRIRRAKDPELLDELLDQWNDWKNRATEWDATQWGFTDAWMFDERKELAKRVQEWSRTSKTVKP